VIEDIPKESRKYLQIGKITMADIDKALRVKELIDPKTQLPK
jgi:hypothetical protein